MKRRARANPAPEDKAHLFHTIWRLAAPPHAQQVIELRAEYLFASPRRFRADWHLRNTLNHRVALVEVEGGSWTGGRHTRGEGFERDCEKYNLAVERGYFLLRYTPRMLTDTPASVVKQVLRVLRYSYRDHEGGYDDEP